MCDGSVNLPPGFRFLPTDEELLLHFLHRKASFLPCHPNIIPDIDPHLHDPCQLNGKALCSGNKWYFFSQIDQDNRVTENGYWKKLDFEEPVCTSSGNKIGMKKYFVFYVGEAPLGVETNWIMQEYHLCNNGTKGNRKFITKGYYKWVLCRVFEGEGDSGNFSYGDDDETDLSCLDEMFLSFDDDLADISFPN